MGWKSKLKKTGRGLKKAGEFTAKHAPDVIEVAAPPVLNKLFEEHGDKVESIITRVDSIAEAVENVAQVVPRLEKIDRKQAYISNTAATQMTAERIEGKVDEATRQIGEVRRTIKNLGDKLDGQTAQLAEIRHLLQRSLDIQLGKEGARDG